MSIPDEVIVGVARHRGDVFLLVNLYSAFESNPALTTSQTPAGIAQHATATCCRGCLQKWRGIPKGRELDIAEKQYVLEVIKKWLEAAA